MFVKPVSGRIVPDPVAGDVLPASGRKVVVDGYWTRRIQDGDVLVVDSPDAAPSKKSTRQQEE